jgi:hypothetical protein
MLIALYETCTVQYAVNEHKVIVIFIITIITVIRATPARLEMIEEKVLILSV